MRYYSCFVAISLAFLLCLATARVGAQPGFDPLPIAQETDINRLLDLLDTQNVNTRVQAAVRLKKLGDARGLNSLGVMLKDHDSTVRLAAGRALVGLGDARGLDALGELLKDHDATVRLAALRALVGIGTAHLVSLLIPLLHDPDTTVRLETAQQLGKLGDPGALEPLIAALKDDDPAVRAQIATTLGLLGNARAVPSLMDSLKDEFVLVRAAAVGALEQIHDPAATDGLLAIVRDHKAELREQAVDALIASRDCRGLLLASALLWQDAQLANKVQMVYWPMIAEARRRNDRQVIEVALAMAVDPDTQVRRHVAATLPGFSDPRIPPAVNKLLHDRAPSVRQAVVAALGNAPSPAMNAILLPLLHDSSDTLRNQAIIALCGSKDVSVLPQLLAMANDPAVGIRRALAGGLGYYHDPRVIEVLLIMRKDTDQAIRSNADDSLIDFAFDPRVLPIVLAECHNPQAGVRQRAATALGAASNQQSACNALIFLLKDSDARVRSTAAKALSSQCELKQVQNALIPMLHDKQHEVRFAAMQVLAYTNDARLTEIMRTAYVNATGSEQQQFFFLLRQARDLNLIQPMMSLAAATNASQQDMSCMNIAIMVDELGAPALQQVNEALSLPNHDIQRVALTVLLKCQTSAWNDYPVLQWLEGRSPDIAFSIPWRSADDHLDDPGAIDSVLNCQRTGSADTRVLATEVLGQTGDSRAVPPLLAMMQSHDANARALAIRSLGRLHDPRALLPLLDARKDPVPAVSGAAYYALSQLRDIHDPAPFLARLHDPDWQVRSEMAQLLGLTGDARAVEPLIHVLQTNTDENGGNRERTVLALGLLGDDRAVEPLIAALHDPVEWVRSAAAWALGKIGDQRAIAPLLDALDVGDPRFQVRVSSALLDLGDKRGWPPLLAVMNEHDDMLRAIGAETLAEHPDASAIDTVLDVVKDQHAWNRYEALKSMAMLKDPRLTHAWQVMKEMPAEIFNYPLKDINLLVQGDAEARDRLLTRLAPDRREFSSSYPLLLMLASIDDALFIEPLARLLTVPDPMARVLAARVLALRKDARGIPPLLTTLGNPRDTTCYAVACKTLGEIDRKMLPATINPALAHILLGTLADATIEQRMPTADIVGLLRITDAYDMLLAMLQSDCPRLREAAACGLGKLGDARSVPALLAALRDQSSRVRVQAATALGDITDKRAVDPLIAVLRAEKGTRLRAAANTALHNITGKDFHEDAVMWQAWRDLRAK